LTGYKLKILTILLVIITLCCSWGNNCFAQCGGIDFGASQTKGCALLGVNFSATGAPAGTSYDWDLGNGFLTGKKDTITGVYSNPGKYTIIMKAYLHSGPVCVVQKDTYITVLQAIVPNVKAYPGFNLCDDKNVITLIDSTPQIISREWVVDGYTFNSQNIHYQFPSPGSKPLSLKLTNKYQCTNIYTNNILVNDSVNVDFCASFTVTDTLITGTYSAYVGPFSGRNIQNYVWSFPGGSPSTFSGLNPTVTYKDKLPHPVTFTILMSDGCSYSKTRANFVRQFVTPVFFKVCKNQSLELKADTAKNKLDSVSWYFPKVTTELKSGFNTVDVSYDSAAQYGLVLTLHYADNPSSCQTVIHYPTYVSILGPTALFESNDNNTCNPYDTVHIINNSNTFGAPNVIYTWYFIDSSGKMLSKNGKVGPTTQKNLNFIPGKYGKISVALAAYSSNGCKDSIFAEFFISVSRPKIDITSTDKFGCYGGNYELTAKTIPDDSGMSSYAWTWQMQSTSDTNVNFYLDGKNASPWKPFDYPPDLYNIFLTIRIGPRCNYTIEKPGFMAIYGDETFYTVSKRTGCPGMTTTVSIGPETIYPRNAIPLYEWSVSPPAGVTIDNPTSKTTEIHFDKTGGYKLTLKTLVPHGMDTCVTVYEQDSSIIVGINLRFIKNKGNCVSDTTYLYGQDPKTYNLKWQIEPHQFVHYYPNDTSQNVKVVFSKDTCYNIKLGAKKLINGSVCSDSATDTACFLRLVSSFNTLTPKLYCAPETGKFVNTSSKSAIQFLWNFGDGTSLFTNNNNIVSHTYLQFVKGDYDVSLTAYDSIGCAISDTVKKIIHITGPVPVFSVNKSKGCDSLAVIFTNTSVNVHKYYFYNDDGALPDSVSIKPHTYVLQDPALDSITFHPVIQSKDDSLCRDFYTGNITIYRTPKAGFSQDNSFGCFPLTVHFTSVTSNAISWKWDFDGDGKIDDSINPNPVFTYKKPGTFTPELTVFNSVCPAVVMGKTVTVLSRTIASFQSSNHSFCGTSEINFNNTSKYYSRFVFDYGDGSPKDTNGVLSHTYSFFKSRANGSDSCFFVPSLTVFSTGGCKDLHYDTIVAYRLPVPGFTPKLETGCSPLKVLFSDTSQFSIRAEWDFDNNNHTDTTGSIVSHIYAPGLYSVMQRSVSSRGCMDSVVKPYMIKVNQLPKPDFSISDSLACLNMPVQFINLSVPINKIKYWSWNFNDSLAPTDTSNARDPSFSFYSKGLRQVSLTATDSNGCKKSIIKNIVDVQGNKPPAGVNLLFISVADTHSVTITWSKATTNQFKAYQVNRIVNGTPVQIAYLAGIDDTVFADKDPQIITGSSSYCYSVQTENNCNLLSFASFAHCTILLKGIANTGPANVLSWSSYLGWSANRYVVYRAGADGVFKIIGSLTGNIFTFTDTSLCAQTYCYYVTAVSDLGYISNSNTVYLQAQYSNAIHPIYLHYATVSNDQQTKLEWDTSGNRNLVSYTIDRNDANNGWINNYAGSEYNYFIDNNVDVNNYSYTYRIRTIDKCGYTNAAGNIGTTLLLNHKVAMDKVVLSWNSYQNWRGGAQVYKLQVQLKDRSFKTIATLTDTFFTDDSVYRSIDTAYCYRVVAYQASPGQDSSISNRTCAILPARAYVPNAFTPGNHDSVNDVWKPSALSVYNAVGQKIKTYRTRVFNRWGTLVFETNDLNMGWDGQFRGRLVPTGVFIYLVDALGLDGREIHLKGNLTIVN